MALSIEDLYKLHDEFEVLLRSIERKGLTIHRIGSGVWAGHDELERLIIKEQAKNPEEVEQEALQHV